jgi:hypothetical protein
VAKFTRVLDKDTLFLELQFQSPQVVVVRDPAPSRHRIHIVITRLMMALEFHHHCVKNAFEPKPNAPQAGHRLWAILRMVDSLIPR